MEAAFTVGDRAVYPVHGVTEVVGLEHRDIGGYSLTVYILKVLETGSTIVVPTAKAKSVGLRQIITDDEVNEIFAILREGGLVRNEQTWNRRQREYTEKLRSGNAHEVAEVLRDLSVLGGGKQLSFSERRLLETAKALLVQEIALARGASRAEISEQIDSIFDHQVE